MVYTFWDIAQNDNTSIWMMQKNGTEYRFIRFFEDSGESFAYFVKHLQSFGYVFDTHFLPHDAGHRRQGQFVNKTAQEMLEDLGLRCEIVPRIESLQENIAINQVRDLFPQCVFDEENCKEGLVHLENYRKQWDDVRGCWRDKPLHDRHSDGADAFRTFAQAVTNGQLTSALVKKPKKKATRNWRTL